MGSLIMNEENEEAKENGEWVEERGRTRKNEIFSLIDSLMNTLLQNLSAQEVSWRKFFGVIHSLQSYFSFLY